jgi:hypothetical protein
LSEIRVLFALDPTRSALLLLGGDKAGNWQRWYKQNIPIAERLYLATPQKKRSSPSCLSAPPWTGRISSGSCMPPGSPPRKSTRARASCSPRRAGTNSPRPASSWAWAKQIAGAMGVSVARVSQIEYGEVTSFEVIARYIEALGGRLDLVADFGDRTIRLPVSDTATAA